MKKEKSPEFKNATIYDAYVSKYSVYKIAIQRLISYFRKYHSTKPQTIIDLACGTGVSLKEILKEIPNTKIIALDKSPEMIEIAKTKFLKENDVLFINSLIENLDDKDISNIDAIFCNAAFWYFEKEKALNKINKILKENGIFLFNISEPAINFQDNKYDDRFLQTMVEVLDDFGIVFHREGGIEMGRLKLSYQPPTVKDIFEIVENNGFKVIENSVWNFTKDLDELKEFYMIPGFGTKAFRELTDKNIKIKIIDEIIKRLRSQSVVHINFRWAEFVCQKSPQKHE